MTKKLKTLGNIWECLFSTGWSKGEEVGDKYLSKMIGRTCVMKHRKASARWFIQSLGQMGRDDFAPNKPVPCGVTHKQLGCVGHPLVLRMLTFRIGNTNFDVPMSNTIPLYLCIKDIRYSYGGQSMSLDLRFLNRIGWQHQLYHQSIGKHVNRNCTRIEQEETFFLQHGMWVFVDQSAPAR